MSIKIKADKENNMLHITDTGVCVCVFVAGVDVCLLGVDVWFVVGVDVCTVLLHIGTVVHVLVILYFRLQSTELQVHVQLTVHGMYVVHVQLHVCFLVCMY